MFPVSFQRNNSFALNRLLQQHYAVVVLLMYNDDGVFPVVCG